MNLRRDQPDAAGPRVALFTDTLGDVNGVSRFIRNIADRALATSRTLTVLTSTNFPVPAQPNIINIPPLLAKRMPRYENLELVLPPALKLLAAARALAPHAVHISTPGPVGLVGLIASKLLRVPALGVYHTDFPAYVERLFHDDSLALLTRAVMRWFYGSFAAVFSRSDEYAAAVESLGIDPSRIPRLRPGIVLENFSPRFRDPIRMDALAGLGLRVLYAGRVSVEKNLPFLTRVWSLATDRLRQMNIPARLVIVGDGPYRADMQSALAGKNAVFLGFRHGLELSLCYASSDLFVFPSTTDTLGQVVMEAQSSGLPVIVTDQGGPRSVVREGDTGFILPASDAPAWADRIVELCANDDSRARMSRAARESMQPYSIAASFDHFWAVHARAAGFTSPA